MLIYSSVTVVPTSSSLFKLYVYGGTFSSQYYSAALYSFDSATKSWSIVSPISAGGTGGYGIYQPSTNSIHFITGTPSQNVYTSSSSESVFQYKLSSAEWHPWAKASMNKLRYFGQAAYVDSDYAVVFGGQKLSPGSFETSLDCFPYDIQILDLGCGNWTYYSHDVLAKYRRMGFGMVIRNTTMVLVGGYDGVLHNDFVEIDLNQLSNTTLSNECGISNTAIQYPSACTSTKNRDVCRASTYCASSTLCNGCTSNAKCQWCDSQCGYNINQYPLSGIQTSNATYTPGSLWNGICPPGSNPLSQSSQCPNIPSLTSSVTGTINLDAYSDYIINISDSFSDYILVLESNNPTPVRFRLTIVNYMPSQLTSVYATISLLASDRNRVPGYYQVRVSYESALNNGLTPAAAASFTLTLVISNSSNPNTPDPSLFTMSDLINILIVFVCTATCSVGITIGIRYMRARVYRNEVRRLEQIALTRLPSEPPKLYRIVLDTNLIMAAIGTDTISSGKNTYNSSLHSGNSNSHVSEFIPILKSAGITKRVTPKEYPIGIEEVVVQPSISAVTFIVIYPTLERKVKSRCLPNIVFGTRMIKTEPTSLFNAIGYRTRTSSKIKPSF